MPTKKPSKPKPVAKPPAPAKPAAKLVPPPTNTIDDLVDEQLVDHSGVFRVTSSIAQAQTGHDEEQTMRFASDSLVMAAQRDGFREDAPVDEAADDKLIEDEAATVTKRERLATLAARSEALDRKRR